MNLVVRFLLLVVFSVSVLTLILALSRLSLYKKSDDTDPVALFGAVTLSLFIAIIAIVAMIFLP